MPASCRRLWACTAPTYPMRPGKAFHSRSQASKSKAVRSATSSGSMRSAASRRSTTVGWQIGQPSAQVASAVPGAQVG